MRYGVTGLAFACMVFSAPALAAQSTCNETVHLAVEPADKAPQVAAVLRRRHAGDGASVETEGAGLRVALPAGVDDALLTRPARIEFRLVAEKATGAVAMSRWQGQGSESVEPQIILDESHLRDLTA